MNTPSRPGDVRGEARCWVCGFVVRGANQATLDPAKGPGCFACNPQNRVVIQ